MQVRDVMTNQVKTCQPGDSLNRAAQIMWENDCGCVPVTDPSGKVVGMLTDRDVCMAAYTQGRVLPEMTVSSAMSKAIVACRMNDSVTSAEHLMRERRVRRLPVLAINGRLAGILSLSDIARRLRRARLPGEKRGPAGFEEVGETLAAICEQPHSGEVSASEAWVAWTGTGTKPRKARTSPKGPGEITSTTAPAKVGKAGSKPTTREKPK